MVGQGEVEGVGLLGNLTPCSLILRKPFRAMATGGQNPVLVPSLPLLLRSPAKKARAPPQVPQGHSLGTRGQEAVRLS